MATGSSISDRGDPDAWTAHGSGDVARDGIKRRAAVQELSPGTESCTVVRIGHEPDFIGVVDQDIRAGGSMGATSI